MTQSSTNAVWFGLTVLIGAGIVMQAKTIFVFQVEADRLGVETNRLSDLNFMLVTLLVITVLRWAAALYIRPKVYARLLIVDPEGYEAKKDKNARSFIGFLWYVFSTVASFKQVYGVLLLWNHPYLPRVYGGGCDCDDIMKGWPYFPIGEEVKRYYMVMLAHHVYSLLELLVGLHNRTDGPEMILHHVATVSVMLFSYYTNHVSCGVTVLAAHNVGDIMINLAKFTRDLKLVGSMGANLVFCTLFLSWFVPRCLVISACVLKAMFNTRVYEIYAKDERARLLL